MDSPGQSASYLRDPDEIYRASFAAIRDAAPIDRLPLDMQSIAVRLIHATGMPDILDDLVYTGDAVAAGRQAVDGGRPLLVDATMVAAGIQKSRMTAGNDVICTLHDKRTPALAKENGTTRSAAAIDLWRPHIDGAIVAIGNAPTALFRMLELLQEGFPRPALILGFPVGFIGAAESKEALIEAEAGERSTPPYITLRGRRGGSAMAAAAVNALIPADI